MFGVTKSSILFCGPFALQIKSENIIACVAKGAKRKVFSSCLQRNVVIVVICKKSVYFADCWKFRKFAKHLDFPLFVEIKFSRFNLTWRAAAKEVNLQHALQQDKLFFYRTWSTTTQWKVRENMCGERDDYDPDCVDYISMDVLSHYVCNHKR